MQSTFSYKPLPPKSIRVIKLRPAHRAEDPLRCTIAVVSLGRVATRPYEALSYVWGEPARQWPLECDGKELLVTRNCRDALVHLRRRFTPRMLWIDAICINQGDTDEADTERNRQVAMMGEIYLNAARVLVWLPPARASTRALFRYLRVVHFFNIIENDYPRLGDILYYVVTRHFDVRHAFCAAYLAIPQLSNNSRPRRDLVLPRWRLYLALRGNSLETIPPTRFERDAQKEFELGLLGELRNLKATVPHDRIYSLYAVFQAMGLYLPAPDYKKDIAQVFEEAALTYIQGRQNLDIIAVTPPPVEGSGFPSWVPNWLTPGSNSDMLIWKMAQFEVKRPVGTLVLTEKTGNACLEWCQLMHSLEAYPSGEDPKEIERILLRPYHHAVTDGELAIWWRWVLHGYGGPPPKNDATLDIMMEKRKRRGKCG
ncbi:Heterokaryon incompatibility protein 6, OR allele [Madurella mycetomatis]|uniref:Heterokaryon incompatibility protein 6, OR allele n=1 Tax=Madurella mycetomatis TaxID=100816 RepID=A0A175VT91_9PEZI|nr:Heterokaryon incompatibility protein 6, OR allele [Madurella mycetomatis]